jgi:hypothetical protein
MTVIQLVKDTNYIFRARNFTKLNLMKDLNLNVFPLLII